MDTSMDALVRFLFRNLIFVLVGAIFVASEHTAPGVSWAIARVPAEDHADTPTASAAMSTTKRRMKPDNGQAGAELPGCIKSA